MLLMRMPIPTQAQAHGITKGRMNPARRVLATIIPLFSMVSGLVFITTAANAQRPEFKVVKRLKLGKAPHQIAFSADGKTAYIAIAGDDRLVLVDVESFKTIKTIKVADSPLGVAELPGAKAVVVTRFRSDKLSKVPLNQGTKPGPDLVLGLGPSFLVPLTNSIYMISVEHVDLLYLFDAKSFSLGASFATGKRPFPAAATSDGRKAFVPNYDDGTVSIVDLWNGKLRGSVKVGKHPSGGTVLPGDIDYAVVVRDEDKIVFVNTASHRVVGTLHEGIGESPFSLVVSQDERLAFVNNTESHDVSIIDLETRTIIRRVKVGKIPIALGVAPSGTQLWVACKGSHEVDIIRIPPAEAVFSPAVLPKVAVLGMIHGKHIKSEKWGLEQLRQTIIRFKPDVICCELPPARWQRIWKDFSEHGLIKDERVMVFPEYTEVILPLKVTLGFEIEACAAWTKEMAELRRTRMRELRTTPEHKELYEKYRAEDAAAQKSAIFGSTDDPLVIHSDAYDEEIAVTLAAYDKHLNEFLGPGGWTNINTAHWRLLEKAIRKYPGQRILVTFGAAHKYWFMKRLRGSPDLELMDIRPYLPPKNKFK